jgi:hypothetical protein
MNYHSAQQFAMNTYLNNARQQHQQRQRQQMFDSGAFGPWFPQLQPRPVVPPAAPGASWAMHSALLSSRTFSEIHLPTITDQEAPEVVRALMEGKTLLQLPSGRCVDISLLAHDPSATWQLVVKQTGREYIPYGMIPAVYLQAAVQVCVYWSNIQRYDGITMDRIANFVLSQLKQQMDGPELSFRVMAICVCGVLSPLSISNFQFFVESRHADAGKMRNMLLSRQGQVDDFKMRLGMPVELKALAAQSIQPQLDVIQILLVNSNQN